MLTLGLAQSHVPHEVVSLYIIILLCLLVIRMNKPLYYWLMFNMLCILCHCIAGARFFTFYRDLRYFWWLKLHSIDQQFGGLHVSLQPSN